MVQTCGDAPDVASSGITFTPTDSALYLALGEYLKTVLPSPFRLRQGQQNRTPSPVGPYCVMQLITTRLLATNGWSYTDTSRTVTEMREVTVQVSAFGPGAGDALKQACGLWRDFYATDWFRANAPILSPLTAAEPRQLGFSNSENQYEDAWSVDLKMQVNYQRTIPQQFASVVTVTTIEADTLTTQE
ncbi:hypothetical protein JK217_08915 [Gluconobacter kondonii]|uniref:phage neck terminator protein n=1 Tax=Gluconobacter kondonii TaxID=941463 RepID=UPI001B8A96F0|nr:hypothetical protein [Gluconobacter kondonii]MBS1077871.1 hypothetical protein [Gluconobacter kondonii]